MDIFNTLDEQDPSPIAGNWGIPDHRNWGMMDVYQEPGKIDIFLDGFRNGDKDY